MPYFKYMGMTASKKFLEEQTTRFCQPNKYNDPFELFPEIRVIAELSNPSKSISIDISGGASDLANYEIPESELELYQFHLNTDFIVEASKNIGITCFSYSDSLLPVNLLMWAHYSESHQGIAIQLKDDSELIEKMTKVLYRNKRPIIDGKLFEEDIIFLKDLYVKSDHWEYESEHRLAKNLKDCRNIGNEIYVCEIPVENIERIVLGVNASEELKKLALAFSKQFNVQVILTRHSRSGFGFEPYTIFGAGYADAVQLAEWYRYESTKT